MVESLSRAAWIFPSLAILSAGGLFAMAVYRSKKKESLAPSTPAVPLVKREDQAYLDKLHEEMYGSKQE